MGALRGASFLAGNPGQPLKILLSVMDNIRRARVLNRLGLAMRPAGHLPNHDLGAPQCCHQVLRFGHLAGREK